MLGMQKEIGSLEKGKRADIVMIRMMLLTPYRCTTCIRISFTR